MSGTGSGWPLEQQVRLFASNEDSESIHIFITGDTFSTFNRIPPGGSISGPAGDVRVWDDLSSKVAVTVSAGRSGTVLDSVVVIITADQQLDRERIVATWRADQTLDVHVGP